VTRLTLKERLGPLGVFSSQLRAGPVEAAREAAAELERLGYGAVWMPGRGSDLRERVEALLAATDRLVVAVGIVSIWSHPAGQVAGWSAELRRKWPGRLLAGFGISHRSVVDRVQPGLYSMPLARMNAYLDELDGAPEPVPAGERVLAALGPRMLELARERSAGSHPYLVPVEHTRQARAALGPEPLLAPELGAVLETDAARAREAARRHFARYRELPNYMRNLLRLGFASEDLDAGGSDRLIDALYAWGDAAAILARVREHREAGADHVCVQVVPGAAEDAEALPGGAWRELAAAGLG
jgi:probable F420-dependent oxidoreductase